jgi:hypothetical protein
MITADTGDNYSSVLLTPVISYSPVSLIPVISYSLVLLTPVKIYSTVLLTLAKTFDTGYKLAKCLKYEKISTFKFFSFIDGGVDTDNKLSFAIISVNLIQKFGKFEAIPIVCILKGID